jgi:hypothetical protein
MVPNGLSAVQLFTGMSQLFSGIVVAPISTVCPSASMA